MIDIEMLPPAPAQKTITFQEPHWSAAKDLIRELEGQGWSFVGMSGPAQNADAPKPPFDPLAAGWVECRRCGGLGYHEDMHSIRQWNCSTCDGLGIVVGPPADGVQMVEFVTTHLRANVPIRWLGGLPFVDAGDFRPSP